MVFPWLSYGFPMVFLWFSDGLPHLWCLSFPLPGPEQPISLLAAADPPGTQRKDQGGAATGRGSKGRNERMETSDGVRLMFFRFRWFVMIRWLDRNTGSDGIDGLRWCQWWLVKFSHPAIQWVNGVQLMCPWHGRSQGAASQSSQSWLMNHRTWMS